MKYYPVTPGNTVCEWLESNSVEDAWEALMEDAAHMPYSTRAEFISRGYNIQDSDGNMHRLPEIDKLGPAKLAKMLLSEEIEQQVYLSLCMLESFGLSADAYNAFILVQLCQLGYGNDVKEYTQRNPLSSGGNYLTEILDKYILVAYTAAIPKNVVRRNRRLAMQY